MNRIGPGQASTLEREQERRRKIIQTLTGYQQTPEHIARRAEAMTRYWARRKAAAQAPPTSTGSPLW